jgi:putative inorganic carbon (hco3(-)) transporter
MWGVILVWGVLLFGAVEIETQYRLFLFLLLPTLIALLSIPVHFIPKMTFLPIALLGSVLLSQVAMQRTAMAKGYLMLSLGWISLFLILVLTSGNPGMSRSLFIFLICLGAFEAIYGLVQSLGGVDYIGTYHRGQGHLATGTLINRNHFAGLINLTIPLAVGALFATFRKGASSREKASETYSWAWIMLLICAFMGLAVFLSLSRTGTSSLVTTLVFIALLLRLNKRKKGDSYLSGIPVFAVVFVILALAAWVGIGALLSRFGEISIVDNIRTVVYRDTIQMILDHPWLGVGPEMYRWRFRPYQSTNPDSWFEFAHNDYLQSAVEWGIPLALIFWVFVIRRFWRSTRLFLDSEDRWRQGIALGCAGSILSILLHSLVDFNLHIPTNLMIFCAVLGLAWALDLSGSSDPEPGAYPQTSI